MLSFHIKTPSGTKTTLRSTSRLKRTTRFPNEYRSLEIVVSTYPMFFTAPHRAPKICFFFCTEV